MKDKKAKRWYVSISIIIIFVLFTLIIITLKDVSRGESKQKLESYKFLYNLKKSGAINKNDIINISDFKEVNRMSEFSNVEYTLMNGDYGIELDQDYQVIGFINQENIGKNTKNYLSESECIEYSRKYLSTIYNGMFTFKQIKDKDKQNVDSYTIAYYKMQDGYICYSSEILLKINKYDGELIGYSDYLDDDYTYLSKINITEKEGEEIFSDYMNQLELKVETLGTPKIGYINIDGEVNQLCYIIMYKTLDDDNNKKYNDIIINCDNGEIVKLGNNIVELITNDTGQ